MDGRYDPALPRRTSSGTGSGNGKPDIEPGASNRVLGKRHQPALSGAAEKAAKYAAVSAGAIHGCERRGNLPRTTVRHGGVPERGRASGGRRTGIEQYTGIVGEKWPGDYSCPERAGNVWIAGSRTGALPEIHAGATVGGL